MVLKNNKLFFLCNIKLMKKLINYILLLFKLLINFLGKFEKTKIIITRYLLEKIRWLYILTKH
jgi:hypothetical protein